MSGLPPMRQRFRARGLHGRLRIKTGRARFRIWASVVKDGVLMDFLRTSMKSIFRKRMRSMLTIIGIAIGVLSVVIISFIGEVGKHAVNAELNSMGISGLCVRSVSESDQKLFGEQELETVRASAGVQEAAPLVTQAMQIESRGLVTQAIVWGIDQNTSAIVSLKLKHGRLLRESDVASRNRVCIVDESFAQLLYKRSNIVGKTVRLHMDNGDGDYTVVGVVESGGNLLQGLLGDVVPTFLYVPFTSLSSSGGNAEFSQIVAKLKPGVDEAAASMNLIASLSTSLSGSGTIKVDNLNQQKDRLNRVLDLVAMVLSLIGGISLLVAGLSIMTVMLMTVRERTREIGIKKSIGASRRTILLEFLTEAFLLSLFGSILGASTGLLLGAAGCLLLSIPLTINYFVIGFCILFAVSIGVLFGVYPALQASRLKPVEALRCE